MLDKLHELEKRVWELEQRADGQAIQFRGTACQVCGLGSNGPMGYVCPRPDCPSAVRCVSNLQDLWT